MALCPEKKTWWKIRLFSGQPIYSPGLDITHRNIQEFYCKGVVPFSHQIGLTRKFLPEQFLQNTCLGKYNCYITVTECVSFANVSLSESCFVCKVAFKNQGIATIELNFLPCSLVHRNTSWKGLLREFKSYRTAPSLSSGRWTKEFLRTLYVFLLLAKSDKNDALSMYITEFRGFALTCDASLSSIKPCS